MTERGFGSGGPGELSDGSVSFLYCIGAQVFASRWGNTFALLDSGAQVDLGEGSSHCLDLVVKASPGGEVVRLDFEFVDLEALLRAAHLDDLARRCSIDQLRDLDANEVAARIGQALDTLMPLGTTS